MNLGELINQVGNILDYNPEVPEYREEVRNTLNDIYLSLFSDRKWKWAQKETKLWAFADVTLPVDATVGAQVSIINDFNGPTYYAAAVCPDTDVPSWLSAGCIITITGGTDIITNDPLPNLGDYWITNIKTDVAYPNKLLVYFQRMDKDQQRLNSIWERTPKLGNSNPDVACTFKHRYITLPHDCVGLIGIGMREVIGTNGEAQDLRPFDPLAKYMDEQFAIDLDEVGRPTDYVPETDYYVKPPMLTPTATLNVGALVGFRAPYAGSYDVCYTFVGSQIITTNGIAEDSRIIPWESGPSPISDSVVPNLTTNDGVSIGNLQVTNIYDGLKKRYYIRIPNSNRFYSTDEYPVAETTTSTSIPLDNEILTNCKPLPEHGGVYQRIRLYPRQDADYLVMIRYMYRPQRLVDDTDSPDVPASGHKYLVFRTAEELFIKHNNLNQAKVYQEKANKELLNLENRWLSEPAAIHIKKPFAAGKNLFDFRYAQTLTSKG